MARSAAEYLQQGRDHEVAGRMAEAVECYATAVDLAAAADDARRLSDALRRLGVLHHLRGQASFARELCLRSYDVSLGADASDLAVDAINALAGFDFEHGWIQGARERYLAGLELAAGKPVLVGKLEQNLGTLASVQGDWTGARDHCLRALAAYEEIRDLRGSAMVYHNLGRIHAAQEGWDEAGRRYDAAQQLAQAAGDVHLQALAALSQAELHVTVHRYHAARKFADQALNVFSRLGAQRDLAGAHRVLGVIFRETERCTLAESHLRSALEMAHAADCPLEEADAARELAALYQAKGRSDDSVSLLQRAHAIYKRLEARKELGDVERLCTELNAA